VNFNWSNHIEDVGRIEPQILINYLKKHGWIDISSEIMDNWQNKRKVQYYRKIVEGGLYQITVPMNRELIDYKAAMLRAVVEIINSEEAKRVRQITSKLTNPAKISEVEKKDV